jgi:hypothetical protein
MSMIKPIGSFKSLTKFFQKMVELTRAVNAYAQNIVTVVTAGTNSTLTQAQATAGIVRLTAGASGDFTITLPATALIIAALGAFPNDGLFTFPLEIVNVDTTFTGTLTAGDGSTTISGTATIATGTVRRFLVQVTGIGTITITNIGSHSV